MLLYAAANSGELALAERYADASVNFPSTYGPMNMSDGEAVHPTHLVTGQRVAAWKEQPSTVHVNVEHLCNPCNLCDSMRHHDSLYDVCCTMCVAQTYAQMSCDTAPAC